MSKFCLCSQLVFFMSTVDKTVLSIWDPQFESGHHSSMGQWFGCIQMSKMKINRTAFWRTMLFWILHFYSILKSLFFICSQSCPSPRHKFRDREDDASQLHSHLAEDAVPAKIRHQLAANLYSHAGKITLLRLAQIFVCGQRPKDLVITWIVLVVDAL